MESEEGAKKALELARGHLASGNLETAKRLALKSQKMAASSAASELLKEIEAVEENPGLRHRHGGPASSGARADTPASASASGVSSTASTSRPKPQPSSSSSRSHTPEQAAVVKRIISCSKTAYYEILSVQKTSTDAEIKKAYRKHSLSVHPDKNSAPGADEAFKLVSTAFQVLSDPDKRSHFDRYGTDPDSRSSGAASASPFGPGFSARGPRGPGMRGQEVSPEDLFNMFFGGGGSSPFGGPGFGSGFGGPGVQTFTFGPGGFRSSRTGGYNRPRPGGPRQGDPQTPAWVQLLPVICLVAFMFLSQLPGLFSSPPPPDPAYSFEPTVRHTVHRQTQNLKADYYVNKPDYVQSHVFKQLKEANPSLHHQLDNLDQHTSPLFTPVAPPGDDTPKTWAAPKFPKSFKEFEGRVESQLLHLLQLRCENESDRRARQMQQASGFFGVGRDEAKLKDLREQKMPACERLERFGYRVTSRRY